MVALLAAATVLAAVAILPALHTPSEHTPGDPVDVTKLVSVRRVLGNARHARGPARWDLTLVEFGDFQCRTCAEAFPQVEALLRALPATRFVFRHCPITPSHAYARMAAVAAEAADLQHGFWPMYKALFTDQPQWAASEDPQKALSTVARLAGLDADRLQRDVAEQQARLNARVDADMADGLACSVQQTPSFFLITPTHIWAAVGPRGLQRLRADAAYWQ
ncbi:MAG: DsbA family protein [Chthonomonadales bacterium]